MPQILGQSVHEVGKFVSPTYRPPLPPGNNAGTHFCQSLSRPQSHTAAGRIMSMKNSNDTIGNRFRDLPVCSAVITRKSLYNFLIILSRWPRPIVQHRHKQQI
jgi:hypothetical protein